MSMDKSNISKLSDDNKYLLAINQFPKFGPVRLQKIKNHFSSFRAAFRASKKEYEKSGIEEKIVDEFFDFKKNISIDKLLNELDCENISILTGADSEYPKQLKEINKPPLILYYKGCCKILSDTAISIVGSRKFTVYGKQVTEILSAELAQNNVNIVSGLAAGIDTVAHSACIKNKGVTIAVLGTGVEKRGIYPAMNKFLVDEIIASGGAIISEFPIGTPPLSCNFPQRNRIVSGLSRGTLIVEAAKKSGALITAKYALEQNREVFAVPGNIYSPVSEGPNNLIKQGAIPVTNTGDILEVLDIETKAVNIKTRKTIAATPEESEILKFISQNPIHVDEITRMSKKSVSQISGALTLMELKGLVVNVGAMHFILGYQK